MTKTSTHTTAVIILNWNCIEDTMACLNSLQSQTDDNFNIIVVDNGSDLDNSVQTLRSIDNTSVHTIFNDRNLGFAGGINTGINWCLKNDYQYVALLNPDAVADRDWFKELHKAIQKNDIGIVASLILHADGKTIDSTGEFYSLWGMSSPRLRDELTEKAPDSGLVFGASGGASLYSVKMLKDIGIFDETFFAYYEDVDLSFRAQLAGYKVYYEKSAVVYHKRGASSSKVSGFGVYQAFKNIPLLYIKNVPLGLLLPIGVRFFLLYNLMVLNAIRRGDGKYAVKGVFMSWVLFWKSATWKRYKIQSSKKVSTSYIASIIDHELPPQSSLRKIVKTKRVHQ